jgi:hypothetical protein
MQVHQDRVPALAIRIRHRHRRVHHDLDRLRLERLASGDERDAVRARHNLRAGTSAATAAATGESTREFWQMPNRRKWCRVAGNRTRSNGRRAGRRRRTTGRRAGVEVDCSSVTTATAATSSSGGNRFHALIPADRLNSGCVARAADRQLAEHRASRISDF